ncbi:hypothetical protein EDB87DRAFT_1625621 [Lactarius vividus]|nr:hypothetical protein EDB87DRAFT_1625621 [Lactarius vividus]
MCVHSLLSGLLIGASFGSPVFMQVMSLPTITNLTATNLDRYHLTLGVISVCHFYGTFNLRRNCYHHLEACHFLTSFKHVT